MSVRESIGYSLHCDFPGCDFATEDCNGEYGSWTDRDIAVEEWMDADGYSGPEGDYCPTHTLYEADDDEERDGVRPMLPTIDNYFVLAERRIATRISDLARLASFRVDKRCSEWQLRDEAAARRGVRNLRNAGWDFGRIGAVMP